MGKRSWDLLLPWVVWWSLVILTWGQSPSCRLTHFRCGNGRCVNLNLFCDGKDDCGDLSDEPASCTPCNRTYFGVPGPTYALHVQRPTLLVSSSTPFLCHLTFTSDSNDPNEMVQIKIEQAQLGKYYPQDSQDKCPQASLEIWEGDRPLVLPSQARPNTGLWCGTTILPRFFYSEATAVTFVLRWLPALSGASRNRLLGGAATAPVATTSANTGASHDNEDESRLLSLTYRFLPRTEAILRYGNADDGVYLGERLPGTLCSRSFKTCDTKKCRLQSPGYPGLYPRNAHCLYRIAQRNTAPSGKRVLLALEQPLSWKIHVKDSSGPTGGNGSLTGPSLSLPLRDKRLKTWHECEGGDYVTIYDGVSTSSPALLRFCGNGPLPEVVSSGPDLVVEFRSSAFDGIQSFASSYGLEGFELDVRVLYVDKEALEASESKCSFNLTSALSAKGLLSQPATTLPFNTTCVYRFLGRPDEKVWLYFVKYHLTRPPLFRTANTVDRTSSPGNTYATSTTPDPTHPCYASRAGLTVQSVDPTGLVVSTAGPYCKERPPPTCELRLMTAGERARPCSVNESFISDTSTLILQQNLLDGTAMADFRFLLAYEFVLTAQDGEPYTGPSPKTPFGGDEDVQHTCRRIFQGGRRQGRFSSPKNVFLFGRGGSRSLRCVYRFAGAWNERVKIGVLQWKSAANYYGQPRCEHFWSRLSQERHCSPQSAVTLQFRELVSTEVPALHRDCFCDPRQMPFMYISSTNVLEVIYEIRNMSYDQDAEHFHFEASYEFFSNPKCAPQHLLNGPGGQVELRSYATATASDPAPGVIACQRQRWLYTPRDNRYLFLALPGVAWSMGNLTNRFLQQQPPLPPGFRCSTNNLLLIYEGGILRHSVCPAPSSSPEMVELFSSGWEEAAALAAARANGSLPTDNANSPPSSRMEGSLDLEDDSEEKLAPPSREVIVEFLGSEPGHYRLKWLEVMPEMVAAPPAGVEKLSPAPLPAIPAVCPTWCPELRACVDLTLWCNGVADCPSGIDEAGEECRNSQWYLSKMTWFWAAAGSSALVLLGIVTTVACRVYIIGGGHSRSRSLLGGGTSSSGAGSTALTTPLNHSGLFSTADLFDKKLAIS